MALADRSSRENSVILFADIEGYSSLMNQDEERALAMLNKFQNITSRNVKLHNGELIKYYGDGCLILFKGALSAIEFSRDIQVAFRKDNIVPLRIGIHKGEILRKNNDAFGNAINITSRIESIGVPGAVIISKSVYDELENNGAYEFNHLGEYKLKNIEDLFELYCLNHSGITVPTSKDLKSTEHSLSLKKPELLIPLLTCLAIAVSMWYYNYNSDSAANSNIPSIAVLAFDDMSPDKDQAYFGEGIAEEILNTLANYQGLKVAGRTSSFSFSGKEATIKTIGNALNVDHILEGSIRKQNDKVRITAQLIDVHTGYHLWSQKYDRNYDDIFDIQDELAQNIGDILLEKLTLSQNDNSTNASVNSEAYALFLRAKYIHMNSFIVNYDLQDFYNSERIFKQSIELDTSYAEAYAGLADLYDTYIDILQENKGESHAIPFYDSLRMSAINKAYMLQPNSAYVNEIKGFVLGNLVSESCDLSASVESFQESYRLNPNSANCLRGMALTYTRLGLVNDAIRINEAALKIDPLMLPIIFGQAMNEEKLGNIEKALQIVETVSDIDSKNLFALHFKGKNYALLGANDKAIAIYNKMNKLAPEYSDKYQLNKIIQSYLNGTSERKNWNDSNSNASDLMLLDYLNGDIESLKKRYQKYCTTLVDEQSSKYLALSNDPLNQKFRDEPWLQELIKKEKIKYDKIQRSYPRAETILIQAAE